jgi:predicted aminopeptidase
MSDTVEDAQKRAPASEPPHRASDVASDAQASSSKPRGGRRVARRVASLAVVALVVFLLTPTGCYLSRAGWEEAKILAGRRQIVRLVDDASTDAATRARLRLVLAARGFAADSIRLRTGDSFTTYSHLERDTLVLVVSGAYRDRLEAYTWWFPIVGRVPYKGFFDFSEALDQARDLERRGYDSYVRPSAAFSTLGWFNDPLLSTTLRLDSINLANTVIHEVTHNTFYKAGQAVFNESFANFVGARGSAWLFRSRGDSVAAAFADADWEDDKRMGAFWASLYRSLDSAYKEHPGDSARAARLVARDTVYARGKVHLVRDVAPHLRTLSPERVARIRIDNNAALLARRIYLTDLELFDRVWAREGYDLRRTIERVIRLAKDADDPYAAVKRWLGEA